MAAMDRRQATLKPDSDDWGIWQLYRGELQRRIGDFDAARITFMELKKTTFYRHAYITRVVDYQLRLIGEKDRATHPEPHSSENP